MHAREAITTPTIEATTFDSLEMFARSQIQTWLQQLLEEEVGELLGRDRYQRREGVDVPLGYRNGHGKPRRLSMSCGTITVRRPRVRGLEERFESRILPLFKRRTEAVGELLPQLYLHGLAERDFELALRGLLGDGAPLSASWIGRLKERWLEEYRTWRQRPIEGELVYLWADGIYVRPGSRRRRPPSSW
jgi:transposase-like protein